MPLIHSLDGRELRSLDFWQRYTGLDCYLFCPGPSLKDAVGFERVAGMLSVTVNTAYPAIRPDIWIGMDRAECYDRTLLTEPFPKIMGSKFMQDRVEGMALSRFPNVWFATGMPGNPMDILDRVGNETKFLWNPPGESPVSGTYPMALHLCLWLGCTRIHLIGCDFGGPSDYHDGRVLAAEHRKINQGFLAAQAAFTMQLAEEAKPRGIEIISCTPGSPINQRVPFLPLPEALKATAARQPVFADTRRYHASDAELLRWTTAQHFAQLGVITGADQSAEWMLPWWLGNLRKHNPGIPVAFADFGMSPGMVEFCGKHGPVYPIRWRKGGWFNKPFACLNSPFLRTVWLDTDCEVKADIARLFSLSGKALGVTADPHTPFVAQDGRPVAQTGVLAFTRGDALVLDWAKALCVGEHRGDQEALNALLSVGDPRVAFLPREWQWLRMDNRAGDPNAKIIHWTGPEGRKIIREKMCGDSDECGKEHEPIAPLVSILMPARNAAKYIGAAIDSCKAQTYQKWELVIVDDGSTDACCCRMEDDKRVRIIRREHKGYASAFNTALREGRGDIIARLDANDYMAPRRLEQQVKALLEHQEASICTCGAFHDIDGRIEVRQCVPMDPERYVNGEMAMYPPNATQVVRREVYWPAMPTLVATKAAYASVGPFPEEFDQGADAAWNFKAIEAGLKWIHVDEPLYYYRRHSEQMTATQDPGEQIANYRALIQQQQQQQQRQEAVNA